MKKIFTLIGNPNRTRRVKVPLLIVACIAIIGLAFFGCKEEDSTPQEHSGTITAFGKTITVKGDASISKADFEKAKGILDETMKSLDTNIVDGTAERPKFIAMLERPGFTILIKTGNATPSADSNKSLIIGIGYLLNEENDVWTDILIQVHNDAF